MILLLVLAGIGAFTKQRIASLLTPGDMITASFSRQYRLEPYKSRGQDLRGQGGR